MLLGKGFVPGLFFTGMASVSGLVLGHSHAAASSFQNGFVENNFAKVGGVGVALTYTYSWSGHFANGNMVCTVPASVRIPFGGKANITPPLGFVVTDFDLLSSKTAGGKDLGGGVFNDPPGTAGFPLPLYISDTMPLYAFQMVGDPQFGPVVSTVPIEFGGLSQTGIPQLFEAATDSTGADVLGADGCLTATSTQINDPQTGAILPQYAFTGTLTVGSTLDPIPEPSTLALAVAALSAGGAMVLRQRRDIWRRRCRLRRISNLV